MTGQTRRRVVLLFGEPEHGDCYLVQQLHDAFGYHVLGLGRVYVEFVSSCYSDFSLPDLHKVAGPHYQIIMRHLAGTGTRGLANFFQDWAEYVADVVEGAARRHNRVVVEGWMLLPAPGSVRDRLADIAAVTVVQACNGRACNPGTVVQVHHAIDAPFHSLAHLQG